MPTVDYFAASVLVNGVELPEYYENDGGVSTRPDGGEQHSVYVEAQTGSEFVIRFSAAHARQDYQIDAKLFIDGKRAGKALFRNAHVRKLDGILTGDGNSVRPFMFSNAEIVSGDGDPVLAALLEQQLTDGVEAGQIRIEFWRSEPAGKELTGNAPGRGYNTDNFRIHEQAKQGAIVSHTTGFGNARPFQRRDQHNIKRENEGPRYITRNRRVGEAPLLTIVFHYRSRALLEAKGFLLEPVFPAVAAPPRPPAPPLALPVVPALALMKPERNIQAADSEMKEEKDESTIAVPRIYNTELVRGVLTIDLTEDD